MGSRRAATRLSALAIVKMYGSTVSALQEAQKYQDSGAILTEYSSVLLQESMENSLVRHVHYADIGADVV